MYLSFCNMPSALAVHTVACLCLSNIVTLNDSVSQPAILFQTASLRKCTAQGTEDKRRLERHSHVLQCLAGEWAPPSNINLCPPLLKASFGKTANTKTPSVNQKAVAPLASACQNSLTFPGSTPDSQLVSESVRRSRGSVRGWGAANTENLAFKALISFKRSKWSKGSRFSLFFFFFAAVITRAHQRNLLLSPYAV